MRKVVKIGGQKPENLMVEINDKVYSVPTAKSMKRKDLLKMKTEEDVYQMFAKYIDADVLDSMTMAEYEQLSNAWAEANGASLGES